MAVKLAVLGDRTSNGKIISATANYFSEGRQVAQNNDKAICSICKGTFPIQATAVGIVSNGMLLVKDQDRVLCQCSSHKVIAGSNFFTS
ncbi:PAAR domain-containing protein [Enterobacter cloacae]|uniref:PAAR domain-containing protein n=1 Tax=Enterobacter cloacae TaxID=550 RepID=UPI000E479878|nr:PAAR domain-containing protein [Enterobacter cloacae]ELE9703939.1 PAAR domain-containing protein [Enterobacter cloacae]MCR1552910.1 PAAR domain-containing protein [Enterobacter cloacae]RHI06016.1 PAAR domain-containing protein [Enterobacter cloacae]